MFRKSVMWLAILSALSSAVYAKNKSKSTDLYPCNSIVTEVQFKDNPQQAAWEWFVCLNSLDASTGKYNWETFKPINEVYLANGGVPSSYDNRLTTPAEVINIATSQGMDSSALFHDIQLNIQVDGLPLEMGGASPKLPTASFVHYQLLMNRGTFDYIVGQQVYNINGQAALTEDLNFPARAWELKTSWLWIGTNADFKTTLSNDGYQIVSAYYKDENNDYQVGYAALSGMHIINKLFSADWLWMTFENENNSKYTVTNGFPAQPMHNITGPTAAAIAQNTIYQAANPTLSHYELIGVQDGFVERSTPLLASSQMESAFQSRSSCVACHHTAAYSAEEGYFNFAIPENGGIQYPIEKLPDSDFNGYNKLDFVWSLKRAKWDRSTGGNGE